MAQFFPLFTLPSAAVLTLVVIWEMFRLHDMPSCRVRGSVHFPVLKDTLLILLIISLQISSAYHSQSLPDPRAVTLFPYLHPPWWLFLSCLEQFANNIQVNSSSTKLLLCVICGKHPWLMNSISLSHDVPALVTFYTSFNILCLGYKSSFLIVSKYKICWLLPHQNPWLLVWR